MIVREQHFWSASYGDHLELVLGVLRRADVRMLLHVHLPHLTITPALAALLLPWYFEAD